MVDLAPLVGNWGPSGLVALTVVMLLTDRLVTRGAHLREVAYRDKQIEKLQATNDTLTRQRDELMELARTTVAAIEALPRPRERL